MNTLVELQLDIDFTCGAFIIYHLAFITMVEHKISMNTIVELQMSIDLTGGAGGGILHRWRICICVCICIQGEGQ